MYQNLTAESYHVLRTADGKWETMFRFDLMKLIQADSVPAGYRPFVSGE